MLKELYFSVQNQDREVLLEGRLETRLYSSILDIGGQKSRHNLGGENSSYVHHPSPSSLENTINIVNQYKNCKLSTIADKVGSSEEVLIESLKDYQKLYNCGEVSTKIERYIHAATSEDIWESLLDQYLTSDKSLKVIASDFSETYGMNISTSTVSKYCKKMLEKEGVNIRTRKQAKMRAKVFYSIRNIEII